MLEYILESKQVCAKKPFGGLATEEQHDDEFFGAEDNNNNYATISESDDEWSPVHHAALGNYSCIVALLSDTQDLSGMTPLHIACESNSLDALKVLLDNGADASIQDNNENVALPFC